MASMSYRAGDESSRRVIDVAIGILIGLRGCSDIEAFDELVRVVHQTGVGIGRLAAGWWRWQVDRPLPSMPRRTPCGASCCGATA
jgi:hypothetical protein